MEAEVAEHRAQMLLGDGRRDGAAGGADDGGGLARPGGLAPRPRAPVDGVLEHGRNRAVVLGGDEQQGVGASTSALKRATGAGTGCSLSWLYIGRSSICDEFGLEGVGPELDQRLRQSAVDRFAPVRADDDAELEFCHGSLYLWLRILPRLDR